jgi:hypothetical protein
MRPDMARPRKYGPRDAAGRLKKPTLQQIKEAEAKKHRENMQTVANQPHRRGYSDPLDRRLTSALGRFCIGQRLRSELYDAGEEWAGVLRRWRAAKGVPDPLHTGGMGTGQGPSDKTVDDWERLIRRIENALHLEGKDVWLLTRNVCIEDQDPYSCEVDVVVRGLRAVAVELGRLPATAHPFLTERAA